MSYILLNLTSEVISSFYVPANMLKPFSRKTNQQENEAIEKYGEEEMIYTSSLKYIKEWAKIHISTCNSKCIVWINNLQLPSKSSPDFKVSIARTPVRNNELWPKTICDDQMLQLILAAVITGGAHTQKKCDMKLLFLYL